MQIFSKSLVADERTVAGGVNDTADQWWVVSMTPLTTMVDVNETVDLWLAVSTGPRINFDTADHMDPTCSRLLFSLKGITIKKIIFRQIIPRHTTFAKKKFVGQRCQ
jgi:hypothetical protein